MSYSCDDNKNDWHNQKEHGKLHIRLLTVFYPSNRFRVIFVLYVKIGPKSRNKTGHGTSLKMGV